jgi:glycosyltransferase involved in cell wall biosynthesis
MTHASNGRDWDQRRRLRVAYLPTVLQAAGAEKQMLALAERLPKDRFEVEFIALSGAGDYDDRARAAGIPINGLGTIPPPDVSRAERAVRRAIKTWRYMTIARRARYDIVDAWLYPADILAALVRPFTRTPIVVAGRRNLGDSGGRTGRIDRRMEAYAARRIDAIVANSAAVATAVLSREQVDQSKLRVIRNGVELADPLPQDARAAKRRSLGIADDAVLIGCVANYRPVKQLEFLVDAFATVAATNPNARLLLVGEGEMRGPLERQIRSLGLDTVAKLHGADLNPRELIGSLDLVVQSSGSEGLPNALLEAAAAGRPIVATAAGGTGEIVIDGETGLLVPTNDRAALATAMGRAVQDPGLRSRLGSAARQHVATTFGMDRFVAEFAALYEELAEARGLQRDPAPTDALEAG